MFDTSFRASGNDLLNEVRAIDSTEFIHPTTDQVIELATFIGDAVRRNNSKPKMQLFDELRLFADECSKIPDRRAIGLAVYAFIAAREGNKKS